MKKSVYVGVNLPPELVNSVDTFAKQQTVEIGVKYTRTDAVRQLLTLALKHVKVIREREKHGPGRQGKRVAVEDRRGR